MSISAEIIADSMSEHGRRITTFLLRYPRFFHAELMTHRVFSRNASSSRAIPVKKLVADIRKDPAMFEFWGANEKGMQASKELTGKALKAVQFLWLVGMWIMTTIALVADRLGAHKQTVNRMIEPWSHITVVVTSTDYGNWFALRDHPDAMPEVMWLARHMHEHYVHNQPELLRPGQWHLPFIDGIIHQQIDDYMATAWYEATGTQIPDDMLRDTNDSWIEVARQVSVARCARTSYRTHDNRVATIPEELALYTRLIDREPLHASPTEHQATPDREHDVLVQNLGDNGTPLGSPTLETRWWFPHEQGNFVGWRQFRKQLPGENQADAPHKYDFLVKSFA